MMGQVQSLLLLSALVTATPYATLKDRILDTPTGTYLTLTLSGGETVRGKLTATDATHFELDAEPDEETRRRLKLP